MGSGRRTLAGCVAVVALGFDVGFDVEPAEAAAPPLVFTPVPDGQPEGRAVPIGVHAGSEARAVTLFSRVPGAASFNEAPMLDVGAGFFAGEIPAASVVSPGVELYVAAEGGAGGEVSVAPEGGASSPAYFTVTPEDGAGPQLVHVAISSDQPEDLTVPVVAFAADASFVAEVRVHFRAPGEGFSSAVLFKRGGGRFEGEIPSSAVAPPIVEYYLEAQDARIVPNRTSFPEGGAAAPLAFGVAQPGAPAIAHTAPAGPANARQPILLEATIEDDVGVTEAWIFYKPSGEDDFAVAAPLAATGGGRHEGTIPAPAVTVPAVAYFLEAADADGHVVRHPEDAPRSAHTIAVVDPNPGDTTPPEIVHTPVPDGQPWRTPVRIEADARDPSGVFAVRLHVALAGSSTVTQLSMIREGGERFAGEIPTSLVRGSGVRYYLRAIDASPNANFATSPTGAPEVWHTFTVTGDPNVPPETTEQTELYSGNGCGCRAGGKGRAPISWPLLLLAVPCRRRRSQAHTSSR